MQHVTKKFEQVFLIHVGRDRSEITFFLSKFLVCEQF